MISAEDVISTAKQEGLTDPHILLARLKSYTQLSDDRARQILRMEGFEIDDLVDPRLAELNPSRPSAGFVKNH